MVRGAAAVARFAAVAAAVALGLTLFTAGTDIAVPARAYVFAMGGLVLARLLLALGRWAPAPEPGGRPLLRLRPPPAPPVPRPPALIELEGLVAAALISGRAAERRLQPRLEELAAALDAEVPSLGPVPERGVAPDRLAAALDGIEATLR